MRLNRWRGAAACDYVMSFEHVCVAQGSHLPGQHVTVAPARWLAPCLTDSMRRMERLHERGGGATLMRASGRELAVSP
jgi:hypothetical protein